MKPNRLSALPSVFCFLFSVFGLSSALCAEEASRKIILTDGVRLILKPETTTDRVAITLFVRVPPDASAAEDATGEIVSRAFLYGNENSSFESIAETVGEVGGGLETFRTADTVAVRLVTNACRIPEAAHLLAQALKNANFSRDALARACRDVLDSQVLRPSEAFAGALETLRAALRPYPAPDAYALRRVTTEAALAYFRERYTSARTVIALVGNFDPRQANSIFDDNLFDFRRVSQRPIMQRPGAEFRKQENKKGADAIQNPKPKIQNSKSVGLTLVAVAPPALDSPDYPAFLTVHALLGEGHASRLFRNIRDAQGIGYDVNALYRPTAPEIWTAYLQWDAGGSAVSPDDALKLLNAQISGIIIIPPTDVEMTRARALAIAAIALRRERPRDEAFLLAQREALGVGYNFDDLLPRRIEAVSRADVLRVARDIFTKRVTLIAPPLKP